MEYEDELEIDSRMEVEEDEDLLDDEEADGAGEEASEDGEDSDSSK